MSVVESLTAKLNTSCYEGIHIGYMTSDCHSGPKCVGCDCVSDKFARCIISIPLFRYSIVKLTNKQCIMYTLTSF